MRFLFVALATAALSACATPSKPGWYAARTVDPITDEEVCSVGWAEAVYDSSSTPWVPRGLLYPFIQKRSAGVYVGFASYGVGLKQIALLVPVGIVEFRIDKGPAHALTPTETPEVFVKSATMAAATEPYQKALEAALKDNPAMRAVAESNAAAIRGVGASMAPVTAVGGDKAASLLTELRAGVTLTYRTQSPAAPLRPGQVSLAGIGEKLAQCGI